MDLGDSYNVLSGHSVTYAMGNREFTDGDADNIEIEPGGRLIFPLNFTTDTISIGLPDGDGTGALLGGGVVEVARALLAPYEQTPTPKTDFSRAAAWPVPRIILECPSGATPPVEDCEEDDGSPGDAGTIGFVFTEAAFGPFSGAEDTFFDESFDEIQPGWVVAVPPWQLWLEREPEEVPAEYLRIYEVVAAETRGTDRLLVLDIRRGAATNANLTPRVEREIVEANPTVAVSAGDRDLCVAAATYNADDHLHSEAWIRFDSDPDEVYRVGRLYDADGCDGAGGDRLRIIDPRGFRTAKSTSAVARVAPGNSWVAGDRFFTSPALRFYPTTGTPDENTGQVFIGGPWELRGFVIFDGIGHNEINAQPTFFEGVWYRDIFSDLLGEVSLRVDAPGVPINLPWYTVSGTDASTPAAEGNADHGVVLVGNGTALTTGIGWDFQHANDDCIDNLNGGGTAGVDGLKLLRCENISRGFDTMEAYDGDNGVCNFEAILCSGCTGDLATNESSSPVISCTGTIKNMGMYGREGCLGRASAPNVAYENFHAALVVNDQSCSDGWAGSEIKGCYVREIVMSAADNEGLMAASGTQPIEDCVFDRIESATDDPVTIQAGKRIINTVFLDNYTTAATPQTGLIRYNNALADVRYVTVAFRRMVDLISGNGAGEHGWAVVLDNIMQGEGGSLGNFLIDGFTGPDSNQALGGTDSRYANFVYTGPICINGDQINTLRDEIEGAGGTLTRGRPIFRFDEEGFAFAQDLGEPACGAHLDARSPGIKRSIVQKILKLPAETWAETAARAGAGTRWGGPRWGRGD